jgi:hypothetical protein
LVGQGLILFLQAILWLLVAVEVVLQWVAVEVLVAINQELHL